jgi:hypothetical protein
MEFSRHFTRGEKRTERKATGKKSDGLSEKVRGIDYEEPGSP